MTAALALPHYRAAWAVLDAIPNLTAYEAEVEPTPPVASDGRVKPYAVLYAGAGAPSASALCGATEDLDWPFQITCVGGDQQRMLLARDWVVTAFLDVELSVTGRSSHMVRQTYADRPRVDEAVRPARFYVALGFAFRSVPA